MRKLLGLTVITIISFLSLSANLLASSNVPSFPSCLSLSGTGNWSSIRNGYNHIPGQEQNIYGDDDVYYLEGGNFVQCLCPANSNTGIQTNWWDITNLEINKDEYTSNGWFYELGSNWNLFQNNKYLAKNVEYTCRTPQPTVTPSPTPTSTPTPDGHSSECVLLSASTTAGTEDLTVEFRGHGNDSAGYVQEYEFNFGDSSSGSQIVRKTDSAATYRYDNPGNYTAKLMIKDSRGVWKTSSKCQVNINVSNKPQVLGTSTAKELPKTGTNVLFMFSGIILTLSGLVIYRHFAKN